MNAIEELFRKLSTKDRERLKLLVLDLKEGKKKLDVGKIRDSEFYRVRKGQFRVIFHYGPKKEIVIDSIRLRNKGTYKGF